MSKVTVLVGTTKGVFLLAAQADRADWQVSGPHCDGWPINHVIADPVDGTLWAGGGGDWQGAGVWRSVDGGQSWTLSLLANGMIDDILARDPDIATYLGRGPAPDAPFKGEVQAIWSLGLSDGVLLCGGQAGQALPQHRPGRDLGRRGRHQRPSRPRKLGAGRGGAGFALDRGRTG